MLLNDLDVRPAPTTVPTVLPRAIVGLWNTFRGGLKWDFSALLNSPKINFFAPKHQCFGCSVIPKLWLFLQFLVVIVRVAAQGHQNFNIHLNLKRQIRFWFLDQIRIFIFDPPEFWDFWGSMDKVLPLAGFGRHAPPHEGSPQPPPGPSPPLLVLL